MSVTMMTDKTWLLLCRNAYIMVAVHGKGYCNSAFHAAKLILNNILRIAAVNVVGDALLWLGKVSHLVLICCMKQHGVALRCNRLSCWLSPKRPVKQALPANPGTHDARVTLCGSQNSNTSDAFQENSCYEAQATKLGGCHLR